MPKKALFNWDNIDTVLLDMDGTLLDLHFDNHFWLHFVPEKYAEKHKLKLTQAKAYLSDKTRLMQGKLEWYCVDYWSDQLSLDIEALKHELKHKIAILPFVPEFLSALKVSRKTTILVTNAHRKSLDLKMQKTGISHYFDTIISAHDLGYPKEEVKFWSVLQEKIKYDPARTLFIDDSLSVLSSAQQYGIRYLLAISKPDTHLAGRTIDDYLSVEHLELVGPK